MSISSIKVHNVAPLELKCNYLLYFNEIYFTLY